MTILGSLGRVDWARMGSPDIPEWMHKLISDDRELRATAFHDIVVHLAPYECSECLLGCSEEDRLLIMQRETAFRLIPFLVELLRNDTVGKDNKLAILGLIEWLLAWKHTEDCLTYETVIKVFRPYMQRLHNMLSEGLDVYKQFANGDSHWLREEATIILEYLET